MILTQREALRPRLNFNTLIQNVIVGQDVKIIENFSIPLSANKKRQCGAANTDEPPFTKPS